MPPPKRPRVVVVEDSPTASDYLCALLDEVGFEVAGTATGVAKAEALVRAAGPELVLSDVHLTDGDGIELARRLLAVRGVPIVLITAFDPRDPALVFEAMQAGALEVLPKPPARASPDLDAYLRRFRTTLRTLAGVPVVRRHPRPTPAAAAPPPPAAPATPAAGDETIVAIGASTGGPVLVGDLLAVLAGRRFAFALVAQHIVPDFVESFATWLGQHGGVPVRLARDGELPAARTAYVAPAGRHLLVGEDGRLRLEPAAPGSHLPSIDRLFESLAAHAPRTVALLLTGMGQDGFAGLADLRRAGALTVAQSPARAPVGAMPKAAVARGAAVEVLDPQGIAALLGRLPPR